MNRNEGDVLGRGRYKLIKRLGKGSYGEVWLAGDTELDMNVAIKTLHPSSGSITDLQKEARTQARLNHQNIAKINNVDIDERFISMEYIEGESLEHCLRAYITNKTWIQEGKAMQFLTQCFEALKYAHKKSVVHGDIKPANIMIHRDDTIKLTDFGVAKVISEQSTGYSTNIVRRLGTITYMAPEVLNGEPRTVKSDLFSLGILAYLLFTGRHPFYSTHPSGLFSVRENILSDEEPTEPRKINPKIPEIHETVIMKMLAKNPVNAKYCSQCGESLEKVRKDQYKGKSPLELQNRAFQLNALGDYEEAIKFCDAAIKREKKFADAHQTRGFALSNLGRTKKALEAYQRALEYSTDRAQKANIHTNRCYIYMVESDPQNMINELKLALKENPYHSKAKDLLERYQTK